MAPARNKKTRTSIDSDISTRQQLPAATPHQSPRKRIMSITEAQKQALIDNLQLEGWRAIMFSQKLLLTDL